MHENDKQLGPALLEEIRALEESLWRTDSRFDDELMERTFAPDFFEFGRSGRTYGRKEMLFGEEQKCEIKATLPLPNFHARYLSQDVVQVTYVSEMIYGETVELGNRSSIWSFDGQSWRLRFHQGTAFNGPSDEPA